MLNRLMKLYFDTRETLRLTNPNEWQAAPENYNVQYTPII